MRVFANPMATISFDSFPKVVKTVLALLFTMLGYIKVSRCIKQARTLWRQESAGLEAFLRNFCFIYFLFAVRVGC